MNSSTVLIGLGFLLLTIIFFGLLLRALRAALAQTSFTEESQKIIHFRTRVVFIGWAILITLISLSGFSQRFELFPVNVVPMLLIPLVATLVVVFSGKMKQILQVVPEKTLIQLQVFRFFVEILLWVLFIKSVLPVQMTFEGRNLDILAGITAPVVAKLFSGNKKVLVVWNIICLGLLINILTTAILSMPTPIRVFDNEPANTIVTYFPFIFLPGFLVPLAYGLHLLSLRQLLIRK